MYQITRNHIVEDLQVTDKGTGEELILHVDLSIDRILQQYAKASQVLAQAQANLSKGKTEEHIQRLGEAIIGVFEVVFGTEQTHRLIDFYGEAYTEMLADVAPFINDVVAPKINEAQMRIMEKYQSVKRQKR